MQGVIELYGKTIGKWFLRLKTVFYNNLFYIQSRSNKQNILLHNMLPTSCRLLSVLYVMIILIVTFKAFQQIIIAET